MRNHPVPQHSDGQAFTLVEVMISMALLTAIAVLLTNVLGGVNRVWITGEQRVENYQTGRAITDLVSRELSQAVISPRLQFVQFVQDTARTSPLPAMDPAPAPNSCSLFWQTPLATAQGKNVCEVGYYLVRHPDPDPKKALYQLKRLFVPPSGKAPLPIYNTAPGATDAGWVTNTDFSANSTIISDGVIGLWFRCFDSNGDAIPWLYKDSNYRGATNPIAFNSAACFQWKTGTASSFTYTAPGSTLPAHRLPSSVEVTVVTLDSAALMRAPAGIPPIPAATDVNNIPSQIALFNSSLLNIRIPSVRTFTARVNLMNSQR